MSLTLDGLPTELYSVIISHVPLSSLQQTVLALTRALPFAPIPLHHLFHSICIQHPDQAPRLYRRLRSGRPKQNKNPDDTFDASLRVHHLSVKTWRVDADVLINLVCLLPNLESLNLWIGPNFAPEHLEDMFRSYMPKLQYLSLRFRPYVKKATYYQFLRGSYFDSTLVALSSWPSSPEGLPTLSIVQDPFAPDPADVTQRFAQPIVFFRLDLNLSLLVHSPATSTALKSLRVRIPSRPIVQPLTTAYLNPDARYSYDTVARVYPPSIELLDISTCSVTEADIETLLIRFRDLKHIILDGCTGLLRGGSPQALGQELDWWSNLGRRCALAGVKKVREREKELKTWYENIIHASAPTDTNDPVINGPGEPRRPRRGRRGLATATISLRGSTSPPRAVPSSSSASATAIPGSRGRPRVLPKIHIVPPLPALRTLSLFPTLMANTPVGLSLDARSGILAEFEKGWNDGIRVIWEKRARIGATYLREPIEGVPRPILLRFKEGREEEWGVQEDGFEGLENVGVGQEGLFFRHEGTALDLGKVPVLCISGPGIEVDNHADGCGHSAARDIWMDGL